MRLLSFLTTSMTLSKTRILVLNKEQLIAELIATRGQLEKLTEDSHEKLS